MASSSTATIDTLQPLPLVGVMGIPCPGALPSGYRPDCTTLAAAIESDDTQCIDQLLQPSAQWLKNRTELHLDWESILEARLGGYTAPTYPVKDTALYNTLLRVALLDYQANELQHIIVTQDLPPGPRLVYGIKDQLEWCWTTGEVLNRGLTGLGDNPRAVTHEVLGQLAILSDRLVNILVKAGVSYQDNRLLQSLLNWDTNHPSPDKDPLDIQKTARQRFVVYAMDAGQLDYLQYAIDNGLISVKKMWMYVAMNADDGDTPKAQKRQANNLAILSMLEGQYGLKDLSPDVLEMLHEGGLHLPDE